MAVREYATTSRTTPRPSFWQRADRVLGRDWRAAWIFYAPTLILLFALVAWPFAQGVYVSFTRTIGSTLTIGPWVGLDNYTDLLGDRDFRESLWITIKFTFLAEIFKPTLGVIAALLIHHFKRVRTILSALILLPWILPTIIEALIWRALYDPIFGGLNELLQMIGLIHEDIIWLGDPQTALYGVVLVNIWAGIPFFAVTNLAGLKSIEPELYDAAAVDGANAWQRFRYVTLPGIRYTLIVSTLLSTIWTMNNYGLIYFLTRGGPLSSTRVIGILTFERAFNTLDFGSGVAISLILLPIFGLAIWVLVSYMRAGTRAEGDDSMALPLRVIGPILRPIGWLFSLLFDAGEWLGRALGRGLRRLLGRRSDRPVMGARVGRWLLNGFASLVLAALVVFEVFPFYWVIVSAFKTDPQIYAVRSMFWPEPWTLNQFETLLSDTNFLVWYRNTFVVAIVAVAIGVLASAGGAYALARLRWRGSSFFTSLMLISYMMPGIVMLIPLYQIMVFLNLNNRLSSLMVAYPSFLLPFASWLLMGYYRSIPEELEDAARIDGANRFQIFWKIILPLARPALLAVTLFALTGAWNEFFLAYVLLRSSDVFTLPIGLFLMIVGDIFPVGQMMAASLLMAIPVIIIYGLAQKYMAEGLTLGGVKG